MSEQPKHITRILDDGLPLAVTVYAIFREETELILDAEGTRIEHVKRVFHGMLFLRESRAQQECNALQKTYQELKQEGVIKYTGVVRYIYQDYTAT